MAQAIRANSVLPARREPLTRHTADGFGEDGCLSSFLSASTGVGMRGGHG